jgi:hypothetical protein
MPFQLESGIGTPNPLEIDSFNAAKVALAKNTDEAGYAIALGERDDGTVTGVPDRAPFEVSADYRMRAGIDTLMLSESWPTNAVNNTIWTTPATTFAIALAGGLVNLNSTNLTTAGAVSRVSSWRAFPVWGSFTLWFECNVQFSSAPVVNNTCEWGYFIATGTAPPTDGLLFRLTSAGQLVAVLNIGGVETASPAINFNALVGVSTTRKFLIGIHNSSATFWIDDVLVASFPLPAASGSMSSSPALPVTFREYNEAIAPVTPQQMRVGAVSVSLGEYHGTKAHEHIMAGYGGGSYQGQTQATIGSTSNLVNATGGALPAGAVPTNTTAALGTGLGGWFFETNTLALNTDGIISSYQVPAYAANQPNKSLYITGVKIRSAVTTALSGGPNIAFWTICFGHTAVSLATPETATSKAPRRVFVGMQGAPASAAAGTVLDNIEFTFQTPILVQPGEFIQAVKRVVGTVGTGGVIMHGIMFNGYWE